MALDTIGSIAIHILENFNNIPDGVSGNMVEIVDLARQHVENYVGESIGSNSISPEFQPPIVNFSKADTIDFVQAQGGGEKLRLAELSIDESGEQMSSKQYNLLAEKQLKEIGMGVKFARSLS
ncbi:MAG: hypothetical protein ACTSUC_09810 [Promethearchaeota archaeon]